MSKNCKNLINKNCTKKLPKNKIKKLETRFKFKCPAITNSTERNSELTLPTESTKRSM